jgi:hypothetical protein
MIATTGLQVVRIRTMADNSIRAEVDFGERVRMRNFEDLMATTVTAILIPDTMVKPELQEEINNLIDKLNASLNE